MAITGAAVLLLAGILLDAYALFQSEYAVGVDGYYYVLQVDTFLRDGNFYFPTDTPLILWLLICLAFIIGNSVLAIKIGAILLQAGLCLGILAILTTVAKNIWLGIAGSAIAAFSSLHFYLIGEFINSLGALTLSVGGGFGILKYCQSKRKSWLFFLAIPAIFLALLSHRSTSGLLAIISISFAISYLLSRARNTKARFLAFFLFAAVLVLPFAIYWQPFFDVPPIVKSEILRYPENPLRQINLPESLMIVFAALIGLASFRRGLQSWQTVIFWAMVIWSFLTTLNPLLNHQTGFQGVVGRLDVLAYVQAAILFPLSISLLQPSSKLRLYILPVPFVILLCWSYFLPPPVWLRKEYGEERETLIRQLKTTPHEFCEKPIIIAPHGKQFVVTSVLGIPSQQTPPIENSYQCTYWLVQLGGRTSPEFKLVEDSEFRRIVSSLSAEDLEKLIILNPHLQRFRRKT